MRKPLPNKYDQVEKQLLKDKRRQRISEPLTEKICKGKECEESLGVFPQDISLFYKVKMKCQEHMGECECPIRYKIDSLCFVCRKFVNKESYNKNSIEKRMFEVERIHKINGEIERINRENRLKIDEINSTKGVNEAREPYNDTEKKVVHRSRKEYKLNKIPSRAIGSIQYKKDARICEDHKVPKRECGCETDPRYFKSKRHRNAISLTLKGKKNAIRNKSNSGRKFNDSHRRRLSESICRSWRIRRENAK